MLFEPHALLRPPAVPVPDVFERDDGDAERAWNAAYLGQWCEPLPEPSAEQQPLRSAA